MRLSFELSIVFALCLSSCGATRLDDSVWKQRTAQQASERASSRALGRTSVELDAPLKDPILAGAYADFVIERGPAGEPSDRWEVRLTAPTISEAMGLGMFDITLTMTPDSGAKLVRIASTKATYGTLTVSKNGKEAEVSEALFPLGIMRLGFMKSCALAATPMPDKEGMSEARLVELTMPYVEYFFPLLAMVKIAEKNKAIQALMLESVQLPSWWNLLSFNFDIQPDISLEEAEPVETAQGPGYRVPFNLKINGDTALYATMTVVEPTGALQLTGGIIAVDGFAPDQPDELFTLRFVTAKNPVDSGEGFPLQSDVEWN